MFCHRNVFPTPMDDIFTLLACNRILKDTNDFDDDNAKIKIRPL